MLFSEEGDMDGLKIWQEEKEGVVILHLKGRLDAVIGPEAERRILNVVDKGVTKLVLNLAEVDYLSSTGLRLMASICQRLGRVGGQMVICEANHMVLDVLTLSGIDRLCKFFPSQEGALREF